MRAVPTFVANLTRVVLAADLSTSYRFRGANYRDLLQVAHDFMYGGTSRYQRQQVEDCVEIADAVWHSWIKPHVIKMLVEKWGASEADAEKTVEAYFRDDSPTYHPERRTRG